MEKIRSFIYLDNYKMYSISSQIFEGLTEYIVKNVNDQKDTQESQKGPVGSGRLMGDIIQKSSSLTEKKFLHDYSYNLFEEALIQQNKVIELDKNNIDRNIDNLINYSFVKIKGRIVFNDLKMIEETLKNYNNISGALSFFNLKEAFIEENNMYNKDLNLISDKNQRKKFIDENKFKSNFDLYLKHKGMFLDENFINHMSYILDYGYNQQFEVQIPLTDNCLFSAQLNRENLKDDEIRIIKKYSRETEKEFVLFGILTQIETASNKESLLKASINNNIMNKEKNMKEAVMNVLSTLTVLENSFTGKLDYEYIVDPIALYIEL